MSSLSRIALSLGVVACTAFANRLPSNAARGEYLESRTADVYTGPCFANSEMNQTGDLAVLGWRINQGTWNGVKLDGLAVAAVIRAQSTLGMNPGHVKSVLILDEKATVEQQQARKSFARKMGGGLLDDVVKVEIAAVTLTTEGPHSRTGRLDAGTLATIAARPLTAADEICHNESTYYPPLTNVQHAMAAYTEANSFQGTGLGTTWSYPHKRSSFVGTFQYND